MANYSIAQPSKEESQPFPIPTSDGVQYNLFGELGTNNFRVRYWYFEPGESSSYHRHGEQEELYFLVSGPGRMRLGQGDDEEVIDVPEHGTVFLPPETPREIINEGEETAHWLVFAAPNMQEGDVWDPEDEAWYTLEEWFARGQ